MREKCVCCGKGGGGGVEDGYVVVCVHVWVCGCACVVRVCGGVWGGTRVQERKSMRSDSHSAESGPTIYQI